MTPESKKQTSLEFIKQHFISVFVSDASFHKLFEIAEVMRQQEILTAKQDAMQELNDQLNGLSKIKDDEIAKIMG